MRIHTVHIGRRLTLLATAALLIATVAHGIITVQGTVKGKKENDPKQYASVSLDGAGHYAAITDDKGAFTIQNVTPGRYTVRVRQGDRVEEFLNRDVSGGRLDLVVSW